MAQLQPIDIARLRSLPLPEPLVNRAIAEGITPDALAAATAHAYFEQPHTMADSELSLLALHLRRTIATGANTGLSAPILAAYRSRLRTVERVVQLREIATRNGTVRGDQPTPRDRGRIEAARAVDLAQLIALPLVSKPVGHGRWMARCPFHDDSTPSLSIDANKGLWHCFGCNAGGDAITWAEQYYGLDFRSAIDLLLGVPFEL